MARIAPNIWIIGTVKGRFHLLNKVEIIGNSTVFAMSSQEHWTYLCVCNVFIRSIGILIVFVMFPSEQGLWLGLLKIIGEMTYSRKEYIYFIIIGKLYCSTCL